MIKKTKIIATIGPATESEEVLSQLIKSGVDMCRFNRKHNTLEWHRQTINRVKEIAKQLGKNIGIIVDVPKVELATEIPEADMIALSYIRTANEVLTLKKILVDNQQSSKIIAKIENGEAIRDLEAIIGATDAVMVARGDLGIEVPMEEIAFWQKNIIKKCRLEHKPVIVATQMLQSMVNNPQPTRAEATDVANAVYDGTDAVMLSEETAIGKYPAETVAEMFKIVTFAESNGDIDKIVIVPDNLTETLIRAVEEMVEDSANSQIKLVVAFTQSGETARIVSSYHLKVPVVAISNNHETLELLSLSYGVIPYYKTFDNITFELEDPIFAELKNLGYAQDGDTILVVHGSNWMTSGSSRNISLKKV